MEINAQFKPHLANVVNILALYSLKNPYFIKELNETKYLIYGEAN